MPRPSPPQNIPKLTSITPTTNLMVFSGTRCSGAWTTAPMRITSPSAAVAPSATVAIPLARVPGPLEFRQVLDCAAPAALSDSLQHTSLRPGGSRIEIEDRHIGGAGNLRTQERLLAGGVAGIAA